MADKKKKPKKKKPDGRGSRPRDTNQLAKWIVEQRTPKGTTPLDRAAGAGFMDIAELLIARDANVNAKENWDWTPLHSAAENGHKDIVELLIAKGADVNAKDGGGGTPLSYARQKGYKEIIDVLRQHGAKE